MEQIINYDRDGKVVSKITNLKDMGYSEKDGKMVVVPRSSFGDFFTKFFKAVFEEIGVLAPIAAPIVEKVVVK
jgi:hypothetical protein